MIRFLKSLRFIITHLFSNRVYDVVFYYPQHFNRDINNENYFFKAYYDACKKNNLTYIILEEPSKRSNSNSTSVPFDAIFYVIKILRKLIPMKNIIDKDNYIGKLMGRFMLRYFKFYNVVVISKSMISFFRGLDTNSRIFDVQHGIIHSNKSDYFLNNNVSIHLVRNDIFLLLFGKGFKDILLKEDTTKYMEKHCFQIGFSEIKRDINHSLFNNNVLITLQFTHDHSKKENNELLESINLLINNNQNVSFYLKHHPRFNNDLNLSDLFSLENVYLAPNNLMDCFKLCSLHVTAYSTCVFEASKYGIPTIIVNPLAKFDYFLLEFNYPLSYSISDFRNKQLYQESVKIVIDWEKKYYAPFNEHKFLNLLR